MFNFFRSKTGPSDVEIELELKPPEENEKYRLPYFFPGSIIFTSKDKIAGTIKIKPVNWKPIHHQGIKVVILGQNRIKTDGSLIPFYTCWKLVQKEGDISDETSINFKINVIDFKVPSFYGTNIDARYTIQVKIMINNNEKTIEKPIYLLSIDEMPSEIKPLKAEVGIQDVLHVEFVIQNPLFDCRNVILGKVHFLVVKIRIVNMFIQIMRTEQFNNGIISAKHEKIISQYELLDGMPVRGDWLPIRFYLGNIKAWPFPRKTEKNLEVSYKVRFLLIDDNGKHYFKDLADYIGRYEIPE